MLDKTWIKKPSNVFIHLWYLGLPRNRELFHSITAKPIHMPQWIRFWLCNTFDLFLCKIQITGLLKKIIFCKSTFFFLVKKLSMHDTTLKYYFEMLQGAYSKVYVFLEYVLIFLQYTLLLLLWDPCKLLWYFS